MDAFDILIKAAVSILKAEQPRSCVHCGDNFTPTPNKPGKINECANCAVENTERHKAKVYWTGKHNPHIEITNANEADKFNSKIRRNGATVNLASVVGRENAEGREAGKQGTGAERGAAYRSNLGTYTVKR